VPRSWLRSRAPFLLVFLAGVLMSACEFLGSESSSADSSSARVIDRLLDFEVERWVDGLELPTGLAFLPDGSALVTEKGGFDRLGKGRVRHVSQTGGNEVVLTLDVCSEFERGLLGVAVDPDFDANGFVYLYRTLDPSGECIPDDAPFAERSGTAINRLARFTWTGDSIDDSSELVLLDGISGSNAAHHGGGLAFGPDRMLYVAVGGNSRDDDATIPSRDLSRLEGKILRITTDPDDQVPPDNPFLGEANVDPRIWASGFRNPFGLGIHPVDGTVMVGDVGGEQFEELNLVSAGGDYGWPQKEGFGEGPFPGDAGSSVDPIHVYDHAGGCRAVISGSFLADERMGDGTKDLFAFTDFSCGKVWLLDPRNPEGEIQYIAQIPDGKSDLTVGQDGLIYVVGLEGEVWRIRPSPAGPDSSVKR
jgi:aldose sugar dehydrogenase